MGEEEGGEPTFTTSTGPVRVITAASLFDGHDAAINVIRRLVQSAGAEVIHLGHDRSAKDVVDCAIQEDAHAVALTSYTDFPQYLIFSVLGVGVIHLVIAIVLWCGGRKQGMRRRARLPLCEL